MNIGSVCRCRKGILGVVTDNPDYNFYKGISFDGRPWQSVNPTFVADTINDYLRELEEEDQMSYRCGC